MKNRLYYLDVTTKAVIAATDIDAWALQLDRAPRVVAVTAVRGVVVSTIFLGVDLNFVGEEPLVFESMVFGGFLDRDRIRSSTWAEAEATHQKLVERVRSEQFFERLN